MIQHELSYRELNPEVGSTVRVKLGNGFKSHEVKLKAKNAMLPRYYRFQIYKGAFRRGVVSEHSWSFGAFLIRILKKEVI